jgi:hypothetical protein
VGSRHDQDPVDACDPGGAAHQQSGVGFELLTGNQSRPPNVQSYAEKGERNGWAPADTVSQAEQAARGSWPLDRQAATAFLDSYFSSIT